MKRKKKGRRPSKNPSNPTTLSSTPNNPKPIIINPNFTNHRHQNNPNHNYCNSPNADDGDDDDERKEKKVKLVVRLPQSHENNTAQAQQEKSHDDSWSGSDPGASDSDPDDDDREETAKEREVNDVDLGSVDAVSLQEGNSAKATGLPLESGHSTPFPDKEILLFILDRLQKKDTYGVFSEPVDLNELPDYLEVIQHPMDFGTVRNKLDGGAYKCLEELEADVFLICSNAMKYNAANTVFFKQAQSIQDLAKRDFENLKHEGDNGEPQPKVVRRGRPPGNRNLKKSLKATPLDHVDPELSSAVTLAGAEDKAAGSNSSYNLRKAPALNRFRSSDLYVSSYRSRNGENHSESVGWNDEFPASILRADMKHGKKQFTVDETRRDTHRQFHPLSTSSNAASTEHKKQQLVPVGLQDPLSYARSLARYAADLGPVAWKIASKRIESVLPPGAQYGPGWVEESGATSMSFSFSFEKHKLSNGSAGEGNPNRPVTPSTSDLNSAVAHSPSDGMIEAVRKLNSQTMQGNAPPWRTPLPGQQKLMHESPRNGFGGMFGCDTYIAGTGMLAMPEPNSMTVGVPLSEPILRNGPSSSRSASLDWVVQEEDQLRETWSSLQSGYPVGTLQPGSSGLQIGSSQQPDLALQL